MCHKLTCSTNDFGYSNSYEILLCLQARPFLLRAIETRDFSDLTYPRLKKHFVESEMFKMIEAATTCVRHSAPRWPCMVQVITIPKSYDVVHQNIHLLFKFVLVFIFHDYLSNNSIPTHLSHLLLDTTPRG